MIKPLLVFEDRQSALVGALDELYAALYWRVGDRHGISKNSKATLIADIGERGRRGFAERLAEVEGDPVEAFFEMLASISSDPDKLAAWQRDETILNVRMNLLFASLTSQACSRVVGEMVPPGVDLDGLRLARLRDPDAQKALHGFPDLILDGPKVCVLIEVKVRGTATKHNFSAEQWLKYANLAEMFVPTGRRVILLVASPRDGRSLFAKDLRWTTGFVTEPESGVLTRELGLDVPGTHEQLVREQAELVHRSGGEAEAYRRLERLWLFQTSLETMREAVHRLDTEPGLEMARRQADRVVELAAPGKRS